MKKAISLILCSVMIAVLLAACSESSTPGDQTAAPSELQAEISQNGENGDGSSGPQDDGADSADDADTGADAPADTNILVAVFSLADEQYEVGIIEKGNTQIVAEFIARQTGAELFFIESTEAYPTTYEGLLEVSRGEENDPPQIAGTVEDMDAYDVVFIGYPIWWGDLPTIVKVFLENYDFSGKTVIPFCTHAGSGLAGTQRTIEGLCDGAAVQDGLAVRGSTAQNNAEETESAVKEWLDGLGLEYG